VIIHGFAHNREFTDLKILQNGLKTRLPFLGKTKLCTGWIDLLNYYTTGYYGSELDNVSGSDPVVRKFWDLHD